MFPSPSRFFSHALIYALAITLIVLSGASNAHAQSSKVGAILEGTVSDSSGAVISNVEVTVRNIATGLTRILRTDAEGAFRAAELPAGTYEVRVARAGFALFRNTGVEISLGGAVHLRIVLTVASTSTEVIVTAQAATIDPTQTSVVSTVDRERIEELPVRSRDYLDFVLLASGVSNAPQAAAAGGAAGLKGSGFTFGGLRARSNNVSIDGLDNNDEYSGSSRTEISPEIVREFQVVNNGMAAESGGASGGSINVVTRSGANIVHGDAFVFAQDGALNARDPFEVAAAKPALRRFRTGFALGGPIVKNRTFYYAAVEQERLRGEKGSDIDRNVVAAINALLAAGGFPRIATRQVGMGLFPVARAETEAAAKLDHQITRDTSLMLRYAFTNNKEAGDAFNTGGLNDVSARGSSFTSDNALSGSLTTVYGSDAVGDLRFQAATRRAVLRTNDQAGPEIDIAGLLSFGRPYGGLSERRENRYQLTYTYTRTRGKHLWKAGGTVNRIRLRASVPDGAGGSYLFGTPADFLAGRPDQFRQTFGATRVDFPVTTVGGFVQDHWLPVPHLTLDFGARYDFEQLPGGFHRDPNNVSPRVGIAWNPASRVVLRAGYGIFYDRYVLANLTRAVAKNGLQAFELVADGSAAATIFAASGGGAPSAPIAGIAPSVYRADPHLATPYSQQVSAAVEYSLTEDLTLRADYLFVRGLKLPRTRNVNLPPPIILTTANAAGLGVSSPAPQQIGRAVFSPGRIDRQFDDIYQLENSARSGYHGISFTISRRMRDELEFSASYTLSKTRDDASDFDEQPESPSNLAAENAFSRQYQHQRFVFNALWDLPLGEEENKVGASSAPSGQVAHIFSHIELASIFTIASGLPANPLTGLDSNRSHANPLSARPLDFGRNSLRLPAQVTMDLRILKYFPFGGMKRLDVVAEVFNLFNHANVAQINQVFGSTMLPMAGFAKPIGGTGARQWQFSLDFEF
jgi:hypothetical protein